MATIDEKTVSRVVILSFILVAAAFEKEPPVCHRVSRPILWEKPSNTIPDSPAARGGFGRRRRGAPRLILCSVPEGTGRMEARVETKFEKGKKKEKEGEGGGEGGRKKKENGQRSKRARGALEDFRQKRENS